MLRSVLRTSVKINRVRTASGSNSSTRMPSFASTSSSSSTTSPSSSSKSSTSVPLSAFNNKPNSPIFKNITTSSQMGFGIIDFLVFSEDDGV